MNREMIHTVKKLMNAIDDGWSVVIWSKEKKFKDINDLVEIDSHGDHRIAMSFLIAGLNAMGSKRVEKCPLK